MSSLAPTALTLLGGAAVGVVAGLLLQCLSRPLSQWLRAHTEASTDLDAPAGGQRRADAPGAPPPETGGLSLNAAAMPAWLHPLLLGLAAGAISYALAPLGAWPLLQGLLLLAMLYPLALVDLLTLTVEPLLVLAGLTLRLGSVALMRPMLLPEMLAGALAGAGLLYLVGFAYATLRGRQGLGEGDPALLALIGAFVGWQGLLPVLLLAATTGLLLGIAALTWQRRDWNTPLPFGPFLCLAGLVVYAARVLGWSAFPLLPSLGG